MKSVDLSVVLPVYNEQDNLDKLIGQITAALDPAGYSYEIVCVNDGSSDDSLAVLKRLGASYPAMRIINYKHNHGLTSALDGGFRNARGSIIAMLDADLQNDPADIPAMVEKLNDYDVVCGWRMKRKDTFVKKMSSKIANRFRRLFTGDSYHDIACGLKVFRRECIENITLYDGLHRFLPILMEQEGFSVTEMVVNHRPRFKGKSKYHIGNRLFHSLYDLVAVKWMIKRRLDYKEDSHEL